MTIEDFLKEHGAEWSKIVSLPAFKAMMHVAKLHSPQHKSPHTDLGAVVAGGHILFGQMQGYTLFERLITEELVLAPVESQPSESYEDDPIPTEEEQP